MLILYLADLIVSSTFPVRLANAGAVYIRQPLKSVLISDGKNSKKMDKKCRKTLEKGKKKRRRPATSLNMRIRKKAIRYCFDCSARTAFACCALTGTKGYSVPARCWA